MPPSSPDLSPCPFVRSGCRNQSTAKSFDVVVDCTGSESGMPLALQLVRPRGTVVMKTTIAAEHRLSLAAIVIDEITVVGSRCGPFDEALGALEAKRVDVSQLITHRFPLRQAEQAMAKARDPEAMKVVFEISGPSLGKKGQPGKIDVR